MNYSIALVVLAATAAHAVPVVRKRTTTHSQQKYSTTTAAINSDETYDPYLGLAISRQLQPEGETKPAKEEEPVKEEEPAKEEEEPVKDEAVQPAKDEPMKEEEATTLPGTVEDTEMSMSGSESMSMSMDQEKPAFYGGIMDDIGNAFPPDVTASTSATTTIMGSTLAIFGAAATGVVMFV